MVNEKEYLQSIKENGLKATWQNILKNYFPNEYFTEDKLGGLYELGLAAENKIPIVENRPLARDLYTNLEVGDIIPNEYYSALAVIYSHLEKYQHIQK